MKKVFIPLTLLASTTLLVSCTGKSEEPVLVTPTPVNTGEIIDQTVTPVTPTNTGTSDTASGITAEPVVLTRTETVTYKSPASPQDPVEFSVTVTDGIITAASATPKSTHEISQKMQTSFASEVSSKVVGKSAKDLDVDAIGGASLTTAAFEMFAHSF